MRLLRTIVWPSASGPRSFMTPFKLPLVMVRVLQLLATIYAEFTVTSMLIELHANRVYLDSGLLARVGLASLAVIWTVMVFCWSTCCNGARVLAVPGMIGDAVAVAAFAAVAIVSRGVASTDCGRLGGTLYLWSDSLGAWIDIEGAALSSNALVRFFDEDFLRRQCTFGQSTYGTAAASWFGFPA